MVDDIIKSLNKEHQAVRDIGTGIQISIKELAEMIIRILPTDIGFDPNPLLGDVQHPPKLSVRPNSIELSQGINKTIEWIRHTSAI